ncbi:hypothetical protein Rin_00003330, partial [Candidatus Regiella insecticola 5.15]
MIKRFFSLAQMKTHFSLGAVSKSASAFNTEKLCWLNHHYINHLPPEKVATYLAWHVEKQGIDTQGGPPLVEIVKLFGERCKTLKEMAESCRYFYQELTEFNVDAAKKHLKQAAHQPLTMAATKLAEIAEWKVENIHNALQSTATELQINMGKVGMPLRVAVTGVNQS